MPTAAVFSENSPNGPDSARGRWARGLVLLLLGVAGMWAFMFVLVPAFDHAPGYEAIIMQNQQLEIRATALFYSDLEETLEAQNYLRNSRSFTSRH